jgi:tagatose 1,6-diphosphate aldolase
MIVESVAMFGLGARRGLDACSSSHGTFAILALDHRQNLRRELAPADPGSVTYDDMVAFKRAVVRALASSVTGMLLDPEYGAAQCVADGSLPGDVGLVVAIEATGYQGPAEARESSVLRGWSVDQAKRMGASAAKLLLYYHPAASSAQRQEDLLATVAAACRDADLPLFVEALGFSIRPNQKLIGEERRRVVIETARRLTSIGGDVLKAQFPYDDAVGDRARWADACTELDAASTLPWVLLSGGVRQDLFEAEAEAACRAGASGVLAGRSVWADAATMPPADRERFLTTTARERMARLSSIVEDLARPWHERQSPITLAEAPGEGWYTRY